MLTMITCGDPVSEFEGFNIDQVEYLLAASSGKAWQLVSRSVDGQELAPGSCEEDGAMIFVPDSRSSDNPLYFGYNPATCDSLTFCAEFPDFCKSDTSICNGQPDLCDGLDENIFIIGYWEVKEPVIVNARTDTVYLHLWQDTRILTINRLTAGRADFSYEDPVSNEVVKESYLWLQPE
jgi:hypothetical protein